MRTSRNRTPTWVIATQTNIEEAAERSGISYEKGKFILECFFRQLKTYLDDDRMPSIRIPFLGSIKPTTGSIRRFIRKALRFYHEGRIPIATLKKRILRFWPIRNRLIKERRLKAGRVDKKDKANHTANDWEYIPSDYNKEHLKEFVDWERKYFQDKTKWRSDRFLN